MLILFGKFLMSSIFNLGTPALTGTTTLTVNVENTNDKIPFFSPPTQRAEVIYELI